MTSLESGVDARDAHASTPRASDGSIPTLWFEDLVPDRVFELGSAVADAEEVLAFARRYDPQRIHTDREWARTSPWGDVVAPGMWTTSVAMRSFVDGFLNHIAADLSPGIDKIEWLAPVRLGDLLTFELEVLDTWESSRGDHLGTALLGTTARRDGESALRMTARGWFFRRPAPLSLAEGGVVA